MSNLVPPAGIEECAATPNAGQPLEALHSRTVQLGSLAVRRLLPVRDRRLIGPWCFLDRFGPAEFHDEKPMDVAPHPHIGLQTVTWLFAGEVLHKDSLGSECVVRPGELSLMTAGRGIAHTEETPGRNSGHLDGVQLWVALPDARRRMAPEYQCRHELAELELPGGQVRTILGEFAGAHSTGLLHSPGAGAEVVVLPGQRLVLPLRAEFEYGALVANGDACLFGQELELNTMYYLGRGREEFVVSSRAGASLIVVGGEPFGETVLMWWNFVARTSEEIAAARQAWESHEIFGDVKRYDGPRLAAPPLAGRYLDRGSGQPAAGGSQQT